MKNKGVIILMLVFGILLVSAWVANMYSYTATEYALDTMCSITAYGINAKAAVEDGIDTLKRLESTLSVHREDSDISRLNREKKAVIENDVFGIINSAIEVSSDTRGAFDITVKPIVDLWNVKGGGPVPDHNDIIHRLKSISNKNIQLNYEKNSVTLLGENVQIDLGAIAKGYCADAVADVLKKHGIKSGIIDLGGNVRTIGKKRGNAWRIGIQNPNATRGEYFGILDISDKCVVTSGGYERYFTKDGKVYHHIIDPRTGYPATSGITSVSIIAENGAVADALSTAVFVLGVDDGLSLLNSDKYGDVGYIITAENGKVYVSDDIDFEITDEKFRE